MSVFALSIRSPRDTAARRARRGRFVPNLDVLESRLAPSTTRYVSPSGNDSNDGLNESSAWRTLNRVNTYGPRPGDTILLEGGRSFSGTLEIWQGDPNNPITIDSYGSGRATISSGNQRAIYAGSDGGLHFRNLRLVGSGAEANFQIGIELANGAGHASNFLVEDVEVTGYGAFGIYIWNDEWGLSDLTLRRVDTHHNGNGAYLGNSLGRHLTNVLLSEVRAYENDRLAPTVVSGFGVQLQGVSQVVVERSIFANNGTLGGPAPGDTGLYILDGSFVRIEHNESYGNWDEVWGDGHGICLGSVDDSVVQYNYTHDNRGSGIVLSLDLEDGSNSSRNTFRYNVSQNDVAGIQLTGNVYNSEFHNNTIFSEMTSGGLFRAPVIFSAWTGANAQFRNNIFVSTGDSPQVLVDDASMPSSSTVVFQNNAYYSLTSPSSIYLIFGSQGFYSLDEFRAGTGQELLFGILPIGFQLDPQLLNPGGGGTIGDPWQLASLVAYQLDDASPLRSAGLDLSGLFGLSPGWEDFYGTALPLGLGFSIGAYQAPWGGDQPTSSDEEISTPPLFDALSLLSALEESTQLLNLRGLEQIILPEEAPADESLDLGFGLGDLETDLEVGDFSMELPQSQDWSEIMENPLVKFRLRV